MKLRNNLAKAITIIMVLLTALALLAITTRHAYAAGSAPELDYTFETVPVEAIAISADGVKEIQPRQAFAVDFEITPWYTTTSKIFIDITPSDAAKVTELSDVSVAGGIAYGSAVITVSADAAAGSTFKVTAGADGIVSNALEIKVGKIPVTSLKLNLEGTDDRLHVGKTRRVSPELTPSYATVQDVRYELSGSGMQCIERFDENSGVIKAKDGIAVLDVNATVTITAYSADNPSAFDSVTLTLYLPSTVVDISADTGRSRATYDGKPLAVASSVGSDTVTLHATVNGVDTTGLNYVIVSGQEYVENGYVQSNGSFTLRPTASWTREMRRPHAEIKIRAAYSDGFDEITVLIYVPVERIDFISAPTATAENYRSYSLRAEAFPKYATVLADNDAPLSYTLNGLAEDIAYIDGEGLLTLPKSLTSKGKTINYTANLVNAWDGVDTPRLNYNVEIVPVYADGFKSVIILKNGVEISASGVKVMPSDVLSVEAEYLIDNVTDIDFTLASDNSAVTVNGYSLTVSELQSMAADNPYLYITAEYNSGGESFAEVLPLSIYVPAVYAEIADAELKRGETLDLNKLLTINGHGYASDKSIEWGEPVVSGSMRAVSASCANGILYVESMATAGTVVRVPYRTADGNSPQYKEFSIAALDGNFALSYGQTYNSIDSRRYDIDPSAPQLEEGQSVNLMLKYNGLGGAENYGLSYRILATDNAALKYGGGSKAGDTFTLTAKAGQSGRGNYIGYIIEIMDGTAEYSIRTHEYNKPSGSLIDFSASSIAIFNRISGSIGVKNDKVYSGSVFELSGWDESATFNESELQFSINGTTLESRTMKNVNGAFVLRINAVQLYNGQEIAWSAEVGYSVIHYKDGDNTLLNVYKKYNSTIQLEGSGSVSKANFTLTGWATDIRADKKSTQYGFNSDYSSNADLTLWACWRTSSGENGIGVLNYDGSANHCHYDILMGSDSVDGSNYNKEGFYVKLKGTSCDRNIFTTFRYIFTFTLSKGGVTQAQKNIDFKISKKGDVPGNIVSIFSGLDLSAGDYKLEWSGKIASNVTTSIEGSYEFRINEC